MNEAERQEAQRALGALEADEYEEKNGYVFEYTKAGYESKCADIATIRKALESKNYG